MDFQGNYGLKTEHEKKFAALEERYRKAEEACSEADEHIRKQGARNRRFGQMIRKMKELEDPVTEFDAGLWARSWIG